MDEDALLALLESNITAARALCNGANPNALQAAYREILELARDLNDPERACPYTFSHTRHWCGYRHCRDG